MTVGSASAESQNPAYRPARPLHRLPLPPTVAIGRVGALTTALRPERVIADAAISGDSNHRVASGPRPVPAADTRTRPAREATEAEGREPP